MRVNEIFYSIQGEGMNTGRPAVFVRLSGCNLKCPFCDTDFSEYIELTVEEIVDEVCSFAGKCRFVVITGGEPTLQDCTPLIDTLQRNGFEVAMESNGTHRAPYNVNWLTISPKTLYVDTEAAKIRQLRCDELKVVFDGVQEPYDFGITAKYYYLQPCDTGDPAKNEAIIQQCVEYIKNHPQWKLSLQTQKILNVR